MKNVQQLLEKLGFSADDKVLIIHADDMGLCHSENQATIEAFEKSSIQSSSIMIPCPWAREAVQYSIENPHFDIGLHVTLTCEWKNYRWSSISTDVSLLNEEGFLHPKIIRVNENASAKIISNEIKAQIDKSIAMGLKPTHLDSHMACLYQDKDILEAFIKRADEHQIPVMIPVNMLDSDMVDLFKLHPSHYAVPFDNVFFMDRGIPDNEWSDWYFEKIQNLMPGLNTMLIHLGYDNEELQAVCEDHPDFGSAWRQRDLDLVNSEEFKSELKKNDIKTTTWKEIQRVLKAIA